MKKRNAKDSELSPSLKAMADPTRLKILLMLEGEGRTVGQIVDFFHLSQPTITRHLQTLLQADLVIRARSGQHVIYSLNTNVIREVCVSLAACFPCCCVTVGAVMGKSEEQSGKEKFQLVQIQKRKKL